MMAAEQTPCSKDDLCCELNRLIDKLEKAEHHKDCFPKKIYPECPPSLPPDPIVVAHPLMKNLNVVNRPRAIQHTMKVTLDGRMAELYEPRDYYFDDPPLRLPPWVRPRIPSVELRGGLFYDCQCWKKNGLKDYCPRWDCGRPECLSSPLPECPPGFDPPIYGVRKGNALVPPVMPKKKPALPSYQFPGAPEPPLKQVPAPPFIPCPLHHQFLPICKD